MIAGNKQTLIFLAALLISPLTLAADVLFVEDGSGEDASAVTALEGDGHVVTTVSDDWSGGENAALQGDLSGYDAVVWSANDDGGDTSATTISSLQAYVSAGGYLFVTGYDSLASSEDPLLANFIANYSGPNPAIDYDDDYANGLISVANDLTQGTIDLVGITPDDLDDQDSLLATEFGVGVTGISCDGSWCSWIYRSLGSGAIAYVSSDGESDGLWTDDDPSDAYYAYNAALRNFVGNAAGAATNGLPTTSIPTMSTYGIVLMILGLLVVATRRLAGRVKV